VGFPGGTYTGLFYVADIVGAGPVVNGELNVALDDADILACFPMKGEGHLRLVGQVSQDTGVTPQFGWENVSKRVIERLDIEVKHVGWFSTYHVHHRVAGKFRDGCVFLLGDAAHVHSPVGGQGMNTGIGDAVNLAWKLAAVLQGHADPALLDTYEPERIAFAYKLVATTDRGFQLVTAKGPIATQVRLRLVPWLLPTLARFDAARRFLFLTISQIAIKYPDSPLSAGSAGRVRGGDRLPWVPLEHAQSEAADNFAYLASLDWQVHCYGEIAASVKAECAARGLASYVFPWSTSIAHSGLMQGAVYLVRPDGHVALAEPDGNATKLAEYLNQHRIRPRCLPLGAAA
jgi:FAD binding domain